MKSDFKILTVGMGFRLIDVFWKPIQLTTGFAFFHILEPLLDLVELKKRNADLKNYFCMRDDIILPLPLLSEEDKKNLSFLENQHGVPTIHNMIMGDFIIRKLNYLDALRYASCLTNNIESLFIKIKPSVIIGGFDGIHTAIAFAVARKLNIPWYAINFTSIPKGLTGFCEGLTPDKAVNIGFWSDDNLRILAEKTITDFEQRNLTTPLYSSANNIWIIIKRLPAHLKALLNALKCVITFRFDKYTQLPLRYIINRYLRKRVNILFLPWKWFIESPIQEEFILFGLHMQPESSIDVWAPFFANQFSVVESIARSIPPTHKLLVKMHRSDADNYSRRQLDNLKKLPGVKLVSPFVNSREFIERSSLIIAIQGNMALEAAILGKPVLVFGDTRFMHMPSVSRVGRITDLPEQIRNKLKEAKPDKEKIIQGFMSYLSCFAPGCYNDWNKTPDPSEIKALSEFFNKLREFIERNNKCAE